MNDEQDAITDALNGGADGYVVKPFDMRELLARVENALRRSAWSRGIRTRVVYQSLDIDLLRRRVSLKGREVPLPPRAYNVLRVLTEQAGRVLTYDEILTSVWGSPAVGRQALRSAIKELRARLEPDPGQPAYILTEPCIGYRLRSSQSI